jgi:hypothetical protein
VGVASWVWLSGRKARQEELLIWIQVSFLRTSSPNKGIRYTDTVKDLPAVQLETPIYFTAKTLCLLIQNKSI